ncbi:MAG: creatininase family protein [Candidatus Alkanophagales archaeon]|nr:MAG: creatininase family protein [Candidatus Alkanophagales archaeon]
MLLERMTWDEVEAVLKTTRTVIIPCGSTEEHGYHLPLATDTIIAYELARRVAAEVRAVVTPPLSYGVHRSTLPFPGTLGVSVETVRRLLLEVCESLYSHGFRNFVFLPGHLGAMQLAAIELAAHEFSARHEDAHVAIINIAVIVSKGRAELGLEDDQDMHAGEVETSIMLYFGQPVRTERAVCEHPEMPEGVVVKNPREFLNSGVMGDATKATREKGEKIVTLIVKEAAKIIKSFRV